MKRSNRRSKKNTANFTTEIDGIETRVKVERKGNKIFFTGNPDNLKEKIKFYLDIKNNTAHLLDGTPIGKLEKTARKRSGDSDNKIKSSVKKNNLSIEIPYHAKGISTSIKKIQKESKSLVKIQLNHELEKMKIKQELARFKLENKLGNKKAENDLEKVKLENKKVYFTYGVIFAGFVATMLTFWYTGMFEVFGIFLKDFFGTKMVEKGMDKAENVVNRAVDKTFYLGIIITVGGLVAKFFYG